MPHHSWVFVARHCRKATPPGLCGQAEQCEPLPDGLRREGDARARMKHPLRADSYAVPLFERAQEEGSRVGRAVLVPVGRKRQ